jgi:hypothetical protein
MGLNKKSLVALHGPISPFGQSNAKAISRRKERRRLLALERKAKKLDRSIERLKKQTA